MKRLVGVVLCISVLTLVLAAPAAATRPTEVSGVWTLANPKGPPQGQQSGNNCFLTVPFEHVWGAGSFDGTSELVFRIIAHGPCETSAPNVDHANLKANGTFTGDLCLGEWGDEGCQGEMYTGSFHFKLQWHLTNPDPDPEVDTFSGTLVIQGYVDGELKDLHGVLDMWGRTGPGIDLVEYSGRVHVDP